MINRCAKFWLPAIVHRFAKIITKKYFKATLTRESQSSIFLRSAILKVTSDSSRSLKVQQDDESPLYADEVPTDGTVADMKSALMDPVRSKLFMSVAISIGWGDVADFVGNMIKYQKYSSEILQNSLVLHGTAAKIKSINEGLKGAAIALHRALSTVKADSDVNGKRNSKTSSETDHDMNIPPKIKAKVERCADEWTDDISVATAEWIQDSLKSDYERRMDLLEPVLKDLCVLLYQKVWNSFRISETEKIAGQDKEYVIRLAENVR